MPSSLVVMVPSPSVSQRGVSGRRARREGERTLVKEGERFLEFSDLIFTLLCVASVCAVHPALQRRTNESAISVQAQEHEFVFRRLDSAQPQRERMPSTSSLTATEKHLVKTHALPSQNDKILSVAIARLYHASPNWQFTGLFGALVFGWTKHNHGWLRLVDLAVLPLPSLVLSVLLLSPSPSSRALAASSGNTKSRNQLNTTKIAPSFTLSPER